MANSSPNLLLSAYTHLGCWKDTARRAVPQIEGSDPRIRGNYVRRGDAINKCYQVARQRKMVIFAVQNGGWCAAAGNLNGYRKYGKASNCKNGKGGPWANDVYRITNPIRPALPKAYTHLGCWKDTARRAVPQIEGPTLESVEATVHEQMPSTSATRSPGKG